MKGKFLSRILQRVVELFTPSSCLECGFDGQILCEACLGQVAPADPLPPAYGGLSLIGMTIGARYEGSIKELILQLKFHRLRAAARPAAALVLRALPQTLQVDMVTSVPISGRRYRERGYNQSELVAREVAAQLGLPYSARLARTTSTHQMGLDRQSRLEQIKGAFFALQPLEGQRVLIVDDVVTTGATLAECATTLAQAGAGEVWGAVVARH